MELIIFILAGISITTIVTKSTLFEPLRDFLDTGGEYLSNNFWGLLIKCPMCMGTWVGMYLSLVLGSISFEILFGSEELGFISFWAKYITCFIADGVIIGAISWTLHSYLGYLDIKSEYYETKDVYLQVLGKKEIDLQSQKSVIKD